MSSKRKLVDDDGESDNEISSSYTRAQRSLPSPTRSSSPPRSSPTSQYFRNSAKCVTYEECEQVLDTFAPTKIVLNDYCINSSDKEIPIGTIREGDISNEVSRELS